MAATGAGRTLTETHRLAQARLGAQAVAAMRALFSLLDPARLDATFLAWFAAVTPVLDAQRAISARIAASYLTTFRTLELGVAVPPAPVVLADTIPPGKLATSLAVTGPYAVKRAVARGTLLGPAMAQAEVGSARAAMRHVLNGGRDTIVASTGADHRSLGWARATSGKACAFCALLASRGPAYKSEQTAAFQAHDGCHCAPEPVYQSDAAWPAGADGYHDLWLQASDQAGGDGVDPAVEFRRLVEGRA